MSHTVAWSEAVRTTDQARKRLKQIAFKTPAPALTAQVNCAYACAAASHADAWLAEHFQKQNALNYRAGFVLLA
ncbi:hypothetical protein [Desulfocurvibacter africanus]|uniref:hypothetical protein n=1 Tax=Desulfocurvibacter africanus TaxID=873 RepID=UPI0011843323|nr:hypothetical protein [Desulfocurvibacter africanus]